MPIRALSLTLGMIVAAGCTGCELFAPTEAPAPRIQNKPPEPRHEPAAMIETPPASLPAEAPAETSEPPSPAPQARGSESPSTMTVEDYIRRIDDARLRARRDDAIAEQDRRRTTPPAAEMPMHAPRPPAAAPASSAGEIGIRNVSVRQVETPFAAPRFEDSSRASVNGAVETQQVPTSLKEYLDRFAGGTGDRGFRDQLDERVLRVLVGDFDAARQPLDLVTDEQQKLAWSVVESLIATRSAHPGDPETLADAAVQSLDAVSIALREFGELRIPTVAICWKVDGFGRFEAFDPPQFRAGRATEIIVYCELEGFASEQNKKGLYHASFSLTTAILNASGEPIVEFREDTLSDECRTRRRDCFIPHLIRLPETLAPGEYVAKVTVVDKLANKVAQSRAPFKVVVGL